MRSKSGLLQGIVKGGFSVHAALLFLVTLALLMLVAPFAWMISGASGVAAAAADAFLCFSGGLLALVWNLVFSGPNFLLVRALGGMLPRMAVPLLGGLVLQITVEPLAEAGVLLYLLIFYPVLLSLETWLSLASVGMTEQDPDQSLPAQPTKND